MPTDPNVHPHWAEETKAIAANLHRLDYFQVLGAAHDAPLSDLKARYHQLQRNYHPDSFFTSPDEELKDAVMAIAKRLAEAWVILRDADKRAKYTRDVTGPERESKLRYNDESAREQRLEKEQETGKTQQGRQLWLKAMEAVKKDNLPSAIRDLKTALIFESGNPLFKDKIAELEARLAGDDD